MNLQPEFLALLEVNDGIIVGQGNGRLGWMEKDYYKQCVAEGVESKAMKYVYRDTKLPVRDGGKTINLHPMPVSGRKESYWAAYDADTKTWYILLPRQNKAEI